MNNQTHPTRTAGFTILELVVAATALLMLSLMVTQLILSGQAAHRYSTRLGRLTDVTHRVTDDLKTDLRAAIRIFGDDSLGNGYRGMIKPWIGYAPIASSKLPKIQSIGSFEKDLAGDEKTGNELLFARHAWSDTYTCLSGKTYRVDIYRFEWLFLRNEGSGVGTITGFNLCKWTSEPLANAAQVDKIADPDDKREVLIHLESRSPDAAGDEHDRVSVVWKFGEDPAAVGTLRQILTDGSLAATPQSPRSTTWEFEQAEDLSDPGLFYPNRHIVARNDAPENFGISRFAIRDDSAGSGAGFPHGLEFQVVGPTAARKILLHLTTTSTNRDGLKAHFNIQTILNVREG